VPAPRVARSLSGIRRTFEVGGPNSPVRVGLYAARETRANLSECMTIFTFFSRRGRNAKAWAGADLRAATASELGLGAPERARPGSLPPTPRPYGWVFCPLQGVEMIKLQGICAPPFSNRPSLTARHPVSSGCRDLPARGCGFRLLVFPEKIIVLLHQTRRKLSLRDKGSRCWER